MNSMLDLFDCSLGCCLTLEFSKIKLNCDWRIAVRLPTVLSQINYFRSRQNKFCATLTRGYYNLGTILNRPLGLRKMCQDRSKQTVFSSIPLELQHVVFFAENLRAKNIKYINMKVRLPLAVSRWEKDLLGLHDDLNSPLDLKEHTELPTLYS